MFEITASKLKFQSRTLRAENTYLFASCRITAQIRRVRRRDDPLQESGARPGAGRAAVRGGIGAQTGGGDAPHLPGGTQAQVPAGTA